ncbi:Gfo/Idh/MocA family oxidoreductase [bacterium]|nr:Gfo/Idh/MocA family oxidoreductase [bacterium]
MLRLGLVGTGRFASRSLAPAIRGAPGVRFRSVVSRDAERAREFAYREGAEHAHASLGDFLADPDLDAVFVASPDPTHEELVLAAAEAGKHVLCEKPLATSAAAARRMRDACKRARVRLGVAYHNRHHPAHRQLFEWTRAGELVAIVHVRMFFMIQAKDASNWRCRAPNPWWAMAAVGTHLVDLACAIVGEDVEDVFARFSSPVFGAENEEIARLSLGFPKGATAEVGAFMTLPTLPSRLEVLGTKGRVSSEGTVGPGGGTMLRDGAPVAFENVSSYQGEVEDFARAVQEGRDPACSGDAGARNIEVLEAAKLSSRSGRRERPERG